MLKKTLVASVIGTALAMLLVGQAMAFDCLVPNKQTGAGSVGTVDLNTGEFTPSKNNPGTEDQPHGGFVTLTDGENTADTFLHAPDGVLPPVREGGPQDNCDGKGLDSAEECFGG
jgi:hypothetical protein